MSQILITALVSITAYGSVAFVAYWLGVAKGESRAKSWRRRASTNERIVNILYSANCELHRDLQNLRDGGVLTDAEARRWERIILENR